jgi:hypothetical protein
MNDFQHTELRKENGSTYLFLKKVGKSKQWREKNSPHLVTLVEVLINTENFVFRALLIGGNKFWNAAALFMAALSGGKLCHIILAGSEKGRGQYCKSLRPG